MSQRLTSYGKCFLCGETLAKNAVGRHLKGCIPAHEAKKGNSERLFHIRVEGAEAPQYWLDLEIPASATLATLDSYLRAIWLECCGHLSAFEIAGTRYESNVEVADFTFYDRPPKSMKSARLERILEPGLSFKHEYDFGTTTELKLKVIGERMGIPSSDKRKTRLLARNYAPAFHCRICGAPAVLIYVYDYPYAPYCEDHYPEGPEEGMPIVNSPRMGECGYDGPFDKSLVFEETLPPSSGSA